MNSDDDTTNGPQPARSGGPGKVLTDSMAKPLAKRFYKNVTVAPAEAGGGWRVLLDGRAIKTPKKRAAVVPTERLAKALAEEWAAQDSHINPARMPMTRMANTAIDAVADTVTAVAVDLTAYAGSDLVCYRAEAPDDLGAKQAAAWNPVVDWAARALDARFIVVKGVMPVEQPAEALTAFAAALAPHEPFRLTAQHVLTTLSGSALLALAHVHGALTPDAVWAAAHVDEDYQIALWGADEEAAARRAARRAEFDAACRFLAALKS